MSLNSEQVSIIQAGVRNAALKIQTLQEELVDHICCEVELLMAGGKDFTEAYNLVKKQVSIATLQKIEKNTMLLIDKKYALMKMTMKISGNISLAFIAFGTLMKIYSLTGANIFLVSGFTLLILTFLPALVFSNRPGQYSSNNNLFNYSAVFASMAFAAGILFKAMSWNGANIMIIISYVIVLLISLPALISHVRRNTTDNKSRSISTFGVISLMVFIVSTFFKMFHLPGAAALLITGSVMLVSVFLPAYTYLEFKKSGQITGKFIFIIVLSIYIITMSLLMSFNFNPNVQEIVSIR